MQEVQEGFLKGPFDSEKDVQAALQTDSFVCNRRFVIDQSSPTKVKFKVIDDFKESGVTPRIDQRGCFGTTQVDFARLQHVELRQGKGSKRLDGLDIVALSTCPLSRTTCAAPCSIQAAMKLQREAKKSTSDAVMKGGSLGGAFVRSTSVLGSVKFQEGWHLDVDDQIITQAEV